MKLKVIDVYIDEPQKVVTPQHGFYFRYGQCVRAGITVELDGELLNAEMVATPEAAEYMSHEYIIGKLRRQMMGEIEKRLFNDFNVRK